VASDSELKTKEASSRLVQSWVLSLSLLAICTLWAQEIHAHEVITTNLTWAREISRVFNRRCVSCHHKGGPAFDLSTYEQARPWAEAIKQEVLERRMPPWGAVKGFGDFRDEAGLNEREIAVISSWVEGGAPRGDLGLLPKQAKVNPTPQMPPTAGATLLATGNITLKQAARIAGVRPESLPAGASLRLVAERPNGVVEPLIWLYSYAPRFRRAYYFKVPMSLGPGTKIRMYPAVGSVSLLLAGG
jgi:hypothetical protein